MTRSYGRSSLRFAACLGWLAIASPWFTASSLADDMVLRSAVRARSDDGVILLKDVASLRGTEITRFADMVVATVPLGAAPKELTIEEIRRRLEQAGANWAKIDLEGRAVIIRPRSSDTVNPPGACAPASVEQGRSRGDGAAEGDDGARGAAASDARAGSTAASSGGSAQRRQPVGKRETAAADRPGAIRVEPRRFDPVRGPRRNATDPVLASAVLEERSIRALVAESLLRTLDEQPDALRLTFEGLDAVTLAEVPAGARVEIEPIGITDADRAEFAVRWWRDGRVERRTNLSAFAEVARSAAIPSRDLRKGDRPEDDDLEAALCWVRPSERMRVVRPGAVGGRSLATGVRQGEPLLESQFEKQVLVKRGERIVVRSVVGSLAVSVDAIAQSDGREGELIECTRIGATGGRRDSKATFSAMVTARGEAVVPQTARAL